MDLRQRLLSINYFWVGQAVVLSLCFSSIQAEMRLKPSATVDNNAVYATDIFEDIPEDLALKLKKTPLLEAPEPGHTKNLDQTALAKLSQEFNLSWQPMAGQTRLKIERSADIVDPSSIEDVLKEELIAQGAIENAENSSITIDTPRTPILSPKGGPSVFEIKNLTLSKDKRRFKAVLVLEDSERSSQRIVLAGKLQQMSEIPVLTRAFKQGEVIQESDLILELHPVSQLQNGYVLNSEDLIDKEVRTQIQPHKPIRTSALRIQQVIKKGESVMVQYNNPPLSITLKCKAQENGQIGQSIKLMNESTKHVLEAHVTGPGQAEIQAVSIQ